MLYRERSAQHRRGFTLLEVLMVVVISSILLSMTLPRIQPAIDRAKLNGAANVVATDLQYAQRMAVRSRKPVAIIVSESLIQYLIRDRDDASIVHRDRYLGTESEYNLTSLTVTPTSNEIFPHGLARQSMTFTLELNGVQREVRYTKAGQVRISVP